MVIDFAFLKDEMMKTIHVPCDHGLILARNDPLRPFLLMRRKVPSSETKCKEEDGDGWQLTETDFGKLYVINASPTVEVLAEHWYRRLKPRIKFRSDGLAQLGHVRVWETPNCSAVYPF
jgi:6-pyruvoyltetrahydropterin/6-carboxytetrahydropterin synthase